MNAFMQKGFRIVVLLLSALPMLGSCATRWGGGSGTVIDAETKAPMAGVHVLIYLSKVTLPSFPFSQSGQGCGPEFYAVSDAQGRFTIPEDALDQPWEFSLTRQSNHVNVVAYARGYVGSTTLEGIRQTGYGDVKEGPLKMTVAMSRDTRTLYQRMIWLGQMTGTGCQCNAMHHAILLEHKDISLLGRREEIARGHAATELMPARSCQ